jgi:flagellar biosynthesis/type III secretory pathway M-ring protein FliF/YscJ
LRKPLFCSEGKLFEDCRKCGCPIYGTCSSFGSCTMEEVLKLEGAGEQTDENRAYIRNGTLYVEYTKNAPIILTIHSNRNVNNISLHIDMRDGSEVSYDESEFSILDGITKEISFSVGKLDEGEYDGVLIISIEDSQFMTLPMKISKRDTMLIPLPSLESSRDNSKYVVPYLFILIAVVLILFALIRKRRREKELMRRLERKHGISLE